MREGKVAGWMATATVKENLFLVLFCFFLKEYFGLGGWGGGGDISMTHLHCE